MVEANQQAPSKITVLAYCPNVRSAEMAFGALKAAGVRDDEISVLARGVQVDKHLILSDEINANRMAKGLEALREPSPLAQKLSEGPLFLLDGCWAAGPIFLGFADRSGTQGAEELTRTLLRAGLSMKEAAKLESTLRKQGGVWLAVTARASLAALVEKALKAIEEVAVNLPGGS